MLLKLIYLLRFPLKYFLRFLSLNFYYVQAFKF